MKDSVKKLKKWWMLNYFTYIKESSFRQSVKVTQLLSDKNIPAIDIVSLYNNFDKELLFFLATECVKYDRLDVLELLIKEPDFDIHMRHDKMIRVAAMFGNLDIVKFFIKNGANPKPTDINPGHDALGYACCNGKLNVVEYFISKNIFDIHKNDIYLTEAINNLQYDVALYLLENNSAINKTNILTVIKHWENDKNAIKILYTMFNEDVILDERHIEWAIQKKRLKLVLKAIDNVLIKSPQKIEKFRFIFDKKLYMDEHWFYDKWKHLLEFNYYTKTLNNIHEN